MLLHSGDYGENGKAFKEVKAKLPEAITKTDEEKEQVE